MVKRMKETNRLFVAGSRVVPAAKEDGKMERLLRYVCRLDDACKNGHCDFSITGEIVRYNVRTGAETMITCGAITEEIAKYVPELRPFVGLHLCNRLGQPMYTVENGMYHFCNSTKETTMEYLRLTTEDYEALAPAACAKDATYFAFILAKRGILKRWKKEADSFIAWMEEKTNCKFVNPYSDEEERKEKWLSDIKYDEIQQKISDGYYSVEAINERNKTEKEKQLEKRRKELYESYTKACAEAKNRYLVNLYILNSGLKNGEHHYYNSYTNTVRFNYNDVSDRRVSQKDFDEFINNLDLSQLPDGVKFELKTNK